MIVENTELGHNPVCIHCRTRKPARARGLCHRCYFTPHVRALYQPTCPPRHLPSPVGQNAPTKVPTPTSARPGSAEKIRVLEERAARGEQLWHPLDAVGDVESLALGVHLRNT